MRVAILSATDPYTNNGGVESYLRNYIAYREKQGDEVAVITMPGTIKGSSALFLRTLIFAFRKHELENYDEIITNTHSFIPFIRSGNARVISIWHGSGWQRFYEDIGAFFSLYTYLDAFLEILDSMFAPAIYAVSQHTLKFITTGMWKREGSDQVLYPVAGEGFAPMPRNKPKDGRRRILFVGNPNNPRKGFTMMLTALKLLPPEYSIIVCGGSKVGIAYEGEHIIEYMGMIENKDMPKFYNMCDCYCLPTTYEGTPITVVEALACKCPIVATKVGGIPEIVKGGQGYLAEYDPRDIAKGIISVIK